eukprot:500823-Pelagomonas_calceolata.AAC.2
MPYMESDPSPAEAGGGCSSAAWPPGTRSQPKAVQCANWGSAPAASQAQGTGGAAQRTGTAAGP